jgi:hypothetical protein
LLSLKKTTTNINSIDKSAGKVTEKLKEFDGKSNANRMKFNTRKQD